MYRYEWVWDWKSSPWTSPPGIPPSWQEGDILQAMEETVRKKLIEEFLNNSRAIKIDSVSTSLTWEWLYFDWELGADIFSCQGKTATVFETDVCDEEAVGLIAPIIMSIIYVVAIAISLFIAGYFVLAIMKEINSGIRYIGGGEETPGLLIYTIVGIAGVIGLTMLFRHLKKE